MEGTVAPASSGLRELRAATWMLSGAIALAPFWQSFPVTGFSALTLGRAALVLAGLLASAALVSSRGALGRPPWAIAALASLVAVGAGLIVVSASGAGCFCAGALPGFLEVGATAVIVATICSLHPPARGRLLVALAAGVVVAAGLALLDVSNVRSHLSQAAQPIGDRLTGPYGNPNLLGFALACGAPVLLVTALGQKDLRKAAALALAVAVVAAALVLSYSRGGIVAAMAGGAAAVATVAVVRWPRRRILLGVAATAALLGIAYPFFNDARTRADFGAVRDPANSWDRGGWDGRAQGPIPRGPAALENDSRNALRIVSDQAGEGASFPLGALPAGSVAAVSFRAAAHDAHVPFAYALQDNLKLLRRVARATGALSETERRFYLRWRVPRGVESARFYLWPTSKAATLELLSLKRRIGASVASVPLRLLGEVDQGDVDPAAMEERFIQSRIDAAGAAVEAFAGAPLEGIGWQRFPEYARREIGYRIATHNEYLRFAAELGAPGLLVLCLLGWVLALATRRLEVRAEKAAVTGGLVAGGVGLLFVNALVLPVSAVPLAVLAGISAGSSQWR